MKPSEIDTLSEDEVLTMAILLGVGFYKSQGSQDQWFINMPGYEAHNPAGVVWHPIEEAQHRLTGEHFFDTRGDLARAYVKWALTSRVTA